MTDVVDVRSEKNERVFWQLSGVDIEVGASCPNREDVFHGGQASISGTIAEHSSIVLDRMVEVNSRVADIVSGITIRSVRHTGFQYSKLVHYYLCGLLVAVVIGFSAAIAATISHSEVAWFISGMMFVIAACSAVLWMERAELERRGVRQ